jgi:beta-fructofuranosidase
MNDPNGLIQWGSTYHLFYQYNPHAPVHGTIHWGHATSENLVHWQHLPVALAPEPGRPDQDGCWSGCAVDDSGTPTLIYTANRAGQQCACLATSADGLLTWQKYEGNPLIAEPPPGLPVLGMRDHCVWREAGRWYQVIGAGIAEQGGAALLYRSADLRAWEYLHPLLVGDQRREQPLWTGTFWECPDFFALDGRYVLVASIWDAGILYGSAAFVGSYQDGRLRPAIEHKLDYGDRYFYAPQSFRDQQGRRIMFGWLPEGRGLAEQHASGWSGVMSLPRVLSLSADGQVCSQPAPELAVLRAAHTRLSAQPLPAGQILWLSEVGGDSLELLVELRPGRALRSTLLLRASPDGTEQTRIYYDAGLRQLVVDRAHSSQNGAVDSAPHRAPLDVGPGEALRLRVFLDHSVLEVFANERVSISSRIYPTRPDSLGVAVLAEGGEAYLEALDAWQMRGIW